MRGFAYAAMAVLMFAAASAAARNTIMVPLDGQRVVAFDQPVATLYIKDPEILDAKAADKLHVTLMGKATGATLVQTFDAGGAKIGDFRVVVGALKRAGPKVASEVKTVVLQRGTERIVYTCTPKQCIASARAQGRPGETGGISSGSLMSTLQSTLESTMPGGVPPLSQPQTQPAPAPAAP
jgi:Flp pilus assembly secretin CpaC